MKEEEKEKAKISEQIAQVSENVDNDRLNRVDQYVQEVEKGTVKEMMQNTASQTEIVDEEARKKKIEEAIKKNLSGHKLEEVL